jgi:hypothetical protein
MHLLSYFLKVIIFKLEENTVILENFLILNSSTTAKIEMLLLNNMWFICLVTIINKVSKDFSRFLLLKQ